MPGLSTVGIAFLQVGEDVNIPTPTASVAADLVTRLQASFVPHLDNPDNAGFDTDAAIANDTDVVVTLYLP